MCHPERSEGSAVARCARRSIWSRSRIALAPAPLAVHAQPTTDNPQPTARSPPPTDHRSPITVHQLHHFARLSVAAELRFLENRHAITEHLESSTARWNELHLFVGKCIPDLRRQTDGAWLVVSDCAVFDRYHWPFVSVIRDLMVLLAAVGRHPLRPFVDVERIPVSQRIEHHRVAALRLVPPHRTDAE